MDQAKGFICPVCVKEPEYIEMQEGYNSDDNVLEGMEHIEEIEVDIVHYNQIEGKFCLVFVFFYFLLFSETFLFVVASKTKKMRILSTIQTMPIIKIMQIMHRVKREPHAPSKTDFDALVRNKHGLVKPVWFVNSDGASDVGFKARKVLGMYIFCVYLCFF